ncbi:MAG: CCA tRNA nucleotidyltransferase, partial [Treponema sp.]|nr:CCA tRNA nucleotidyltransferase [Treponema sp.]
MNRIRIPADLAKVNDIFKKNGFKAYLVGGAVRDILRKEEGHDWDLATNAKPEDVMRIFHRVIPTGIAHGTVTIHIFGHDIETTTFRTESSYSDGRHPDKVAYAATIEEDLSRRDFTINAIAADLETGDLIDPFKGQDDIHKKIIRTVGSPLERFDEDGLRPVRAIRFAAQLGFEIEGSTLKAISQAQVLKKTSSVSVERFRDEWCKMLQSEKPSIALRLLEESGILDIFIPEFKSCRGCLQKDARGYHDFDVADHLFYVCDGAPKENLIVRLAAFFHDLGKPKARAVELKDGLELIHFHRHEIFSEALCRDIMTRLKFPNESINRVCHLVREHMFFYEGNWSDSTVRRFIIRV